MPDPAIRAALEAAHKARVRSRYERMRTMFARGVDQELADSSADTAAAIVAFLRAMASPDDDATIWCCETAAAVEEAVRDA